MSTVVTWDSGFSSCTIVRDAMVNCMARQCRFHVLGEHMRDRVLHRISEFYRLCVANRPLRSLVVATRNELLDTGIFLAREDLRAAVLPIPAALAHLLSAPREATCMQLGPRPSSQATSSRFPSAMR